MKKKYVILKESLADPGNVTQEVIKQFRKEGDAVAYYTNPKNSHRLNACTMLKYDSDGSVKRWDERTEDWKETE